MIGRTEGGRRERPARLNERNDRIIRRRKCFVRRAGDHPKSTATAGHSTASDNEESSANRVEMEKCWPSQRFTAARAVTPNNNLSTKFIVEQREKRLSELVRHKSRLFVVFGFVRLDRSENAR